MGAGFELLSRFLVHVRRPQHGVDSLLGGKWDRSRDHCTCGLHCFYDLLCRLVDQIMIIRFQFDTNLLTSHYVEPSSLLRSSVVLLSSITTTVHDLPAYHRPGRLRGRDSDGLTQQLLLQHRKPQCGRLHESRIADLLPSRYR